MKNIFFTIIDKNYILRAYTLFKSIKQFLKKDEFYIVCIDLESYNFLKKQRERRLKLLFLDNINEKLVQKLKNSREYNEFCWTTKSISFDYFFREKNIRWVIYLDSDSMVFASIKEYLDDNYDLMITPHSGKHNYFKSIEKQVGKFNAGFLAFKNNINGNKILKYWKKKCIESANNKPTGNIYGDQKYFDEIQNKFKRINVCSFPGINMAPWNLCTKSGKIDYDGEEKIVFYHMQGLKFYNKNIYNIYSSNFKVTQRAYDYIYKPYILLLKKNYIELKKTHNTFKQKKEFKIDIIFLIKTCIFKSNVKTLYWWNK
mgnify:CR=1 FL=1